MKALVVDGYNVIFKARGLASLADNDLMAARTEVTRLARDYARHTGGVAKVKVVFDGQDRFAGLSDDPCQIYSKTGQGDREIVNTIAAMCERYSVLVVSDDNFIINSARAYNCAVISVNAFSIAKEKQKNAARSKDDPSRNIPRAMIKKINEDLLREWS